MHTFGNRECLLAVLNGARPGNYRQRRAADGGVGAGKADDGVVFLNVAADQFVRLGDADDFLHARQFFQRARLDLALVAGNADGGALRAGDGVGAVAHRLDFLADRTHLLFGGVRLHDD